MSEQTSGGGPTATALTAFSDAMADAVERAGQSIVRVDGRHRQPASGIIWSSDGLIATADHVVERDDDLGIGLPDGRSVRAKLVGRDPGSDLALLKVEATGLRPIGRGEAPRIGSLALIVARPGPDLMASLGTVSAISGPIRTRRGGRMDGLIATDATFYPGFSGAPLISASGAALGLATSRFRGGRGSGVIIPLGSVERTVAALSAHGHIRRGFVGIGSQPVQLPEGLRQGLGLGDQETGLLVVNVETGGPADQAGLLLGDVIVAFGGEPVRDPGELRDLLGSERVGQQATLRIVRGGEPRELTLTVGERN
jgi:S1-C subfamily serine protease